MELKMILTRILTECVDARYFAVGSADSLVSLWDVKGLLCIKTFTKLEYVSLLLNHTFFFLSNVSKI